MRVRRLLAAAITVGLVAPTAAIVSTSSPASAALATQIVSGSTTKPWISVSKYSSQPGAAVYKKDSISLSINVKDANGEDVYDGGLTVQRQLKGASTWETVASSSSAYIYDSFPVVGTATYRVLYAGTAEYAPTGASAAFAAQRELAIGTVTGKRAGFKGSISPKAKVKITIQKKVGKKWKKFRVQKSTSKGKFTVILPAPRKGKFNWKITFAGTKGFTSSVLTGWTKRGY